MKNNIFSLDDVGHCRFLQGARHSEPVTSLPAQSRDAHRTPSGDSIGRKLRQSVRLLDVGLSTPSRTNADDSTRRPTNCHWGGDHTRYL